MGNAVAKIFDAENNQPIENALLDPAVIDVKQYQHYVFHDVFNGCHSPGYASVISRSREEAIQTIIAQYLKENEMQDSYHAYWHKLHAVAGRNDPNLQEKTGKTLEEWEEGAPPLPTTGNHAGTWTSQIYSGDRELLRKNELYQMLTNATMYIIPLDQVFYCGGVDV